jgi:predicted transglutaminase-like cysteine proteinase
MQTRAANRPGDRKSVAIGGLMALGLLVPPAVAQTLPMAPPVAAESLPPLAAQPPPAAPDADVDDLLSRPPPEPEEVFGYLSVDVATTPFDEQWLRASTGPWPQGNVQLDAFVGQLARLPAPQRVDQANRWINAHIAYASDIDVYGVADYWAGLAEALAHGRGDCEDFAIAKMQLLAAAGTPMRDMYLTLVRDLRRQADHAVLVVRVGEGAYVLDSDDDTLMRSDELRRFRPVVAFSESGRWIFGHRTPAAEAEMAKEAPDLPPEAPAPVVAAFTPGR